MDTRKLAMQTQPLGLSEQELLWRALMTKFEDASQDVLACLHVHETQRTQKALDALIRAQLRRSRALSDMLQFLDSMDDVNWRSR
jgi:hypothetical protein